MKKITVYILLLLLLSSICSCLDDKNNYDYTPINELKGTISNIEKNYSVGIEEDLVITPTFEFTIDKTAPDVSYEWRLEGELLNEKHLRILSILIRSDCLNSHFPSSTIKQGLSTLLQQTFWFVLLIREDGWFCLT